MLLGREIVMLVLHLRCVYTWGLTFNSPMVQGPLQLWGRKEPLVRCDYFVGGHRSIAQLLTCIFHVFPVVL